jgi:hypothetical protein
VGDALPLLRLLLGSSVSSTSMVGTGAVWYLVAVQW